jgi:hypothetical protein
MNENPAAAWFAQQMAAYNQSFVSNAFADHAVMLSGIQPSVFGFPQAQPAGFYQPAPAYRPPTGERSAMSRNFGLSRKKMKVKRRLKQGRATIFNGQVYLD